MKKINISKDEVLENFKILGALPDDLHKRLVEKGKIRVDDFNDLEINIEYEIHKDSKYSKTLYTFTR